MSGTVFYDDFPGTTFISYRGDEAEPFDHRGHPLQFAEWPAADHTLPQTPQFPFPFVRIHATNPVGRSRDGPLTYQRLLLGISAGLSPQATPPPGFCLFHQSRAECVALHVATHRQQMLLRLDHEGFEPALIEVSCSDRLPMGMPPLCMGEGEPVHEPGEIAVPSRPDDEMPVIGHNTVRQQSHRHPFTGLRPTRANAA